MRVTYIFSEMTLTEAHVSNVMVIEVPSMLKSIRILELALSLTVDKPKDFSQHNTVDLWVGSLHKDSFPWAGLRVPSIPCRCDLVYQNFCNFAFF